MQWMGKQLVVRRTLFVPIVPLAAAACTLAAGCHSAPTAAPGMVMAPQSAHYYPNDPPHCDLPARHVVDPEPQGNFQRVFNDTDFLSAIANNGYGTRCGEITDAKFIEVGRAIPQLVQGVCDGLQRSGGHTGEYSQ